MIEPELIFCDLADIMDCAEEYVNKSDIEFLAQRQIGEWEKLTDVDKSQPPKNLQDSLSDLIRQPFGRCSYTDAISLLQKVSVN
jgi:aspartyl/asparaginyl-tRNA synthetase